MLNFYACMFRLFGAKNLGGGGGGGGGAGGGGGGGGHLAPPHATALVKIFHPEFYFDL